MCGPVCFVCLAVFAQAAAPAVPNAGFEIIGEDGNFAKGWRVAIGGGADAVVEIDEQVYHSGARSVRLSNRSPMKAFVFASFHSDLIPVESNTTYVLKFFTKGLNAKQCYAGIGFRGNGDHRRYLPGDTFDWRAFECLFTTPRDCTAVDIRFASDDVTEALWIDDVVLERSPRQLADIAERRYPKDFDGVWPRSKGPLPRRLMVYDRTGESEDLGLLPAALQGLVNRKQPRLYYINKTNPPRYDEDWLRYMQEKGYTDAEERIADFDTLLERFRDEIAGVIVYDPDLPGSINAACMLAGLENALPASPDQVPALDLPVVMDLRGKWTRNVDAYRYVYENHWDEMNHHVLAWIHPLCAHSYVRDYMIEFNVFCFWLSGYSDNEKGADPAAEEAFIHELLANTPANIPVMGWPAYGDTKGMQEYSGVRWLSEYGKFVPGTEFCSNFSIHSAIQPEGGLFRRKCPENAPSVTLDTDKVYLSVNILDSGDALWYWQLYQRKIWADPVRGKVPIGWCMNVTLCDTLPLVLEWYYENATPNDTFFAAVSGLGYMNTQTYANRFRAEDRERIWREYVALTDAYCRKLDLHGIEIYNGSWGEPTPPSEDTFRRFVDGMDGLDYILADLGRHEGTSPDKADYMIGDTAVFHALTRFQVWSSSSEVAEKTMENSNAWLLDEIVSNTPAHRPAFMSAMAISWYYYPAWIEDLKQKLPPEYVLASPSELARLFRGQAGQDSP